MSAGEPPGGGGGDGPRESIVFESEIDPSSLRDSTDEIDQSLEGAGEIEIDADTGQLDGLEAPSMDADLGIGGGGGDDESAEALAGIDRQLERRLPVKQAGVAAAAVLPVALAGSIGTSIAKNLFQASSRLQTSSSILSSAWNSFWRPIGDDLDQLFVRDAVTGMRRDLQQFEREYRTDSRLDAFVGLGVRNIRELRAIGRATEVLFPMWGTLRRTFFPQTIDALVGNRKVNAAIAALAEEWLPNLEFLEDLPSLEDISELDFGLGSGDLDFDVDSREVWSWIDTPDKSVWGWIDTPDKSVWEWITSEAKDVWDWIKTRPRSVWDWIDRKTQTVWDWIDTPSVSVWNWIDTPSFSIWDIIDGVGDSGQPDRSEPIDTGGPGPPAGGAGPQNRALTDPVNFRGAQIEREEADLFRGVQRGGSVDSPMAELRRAIESATRSGGGDTRDVVQAINRMADRVESKLDRVDRDIRSESVTEIKVGERQLAEAVESALDRHISATDPLVRG